MATILFATTQLPPLPIRTSLRNLSTNLKSSLIRFAFTIDWRLIKATVRHPLHLVATVDHKIQVLSLVTRICSCSSAPMVPSAVQVSKSATQNKVSITWQHVWFMFQGWFMALTIHTLTNDKIKLSFAYPECGGTITSPTIISSPSHPDTYYNNLNCTWRIEAPADQVIDIK